MTSEKWTLSSVIRKFNPLLNICDGRAMVEGIDARDG